MQETGHVFDNGGYCQHENTRSPCSEEDTRICSTLPGTKKPKHAKAMLDAQQTFDLNDLETNSEVQLLKPPLGAECWIYYSMRNITRAELANNDFPLEHHDLRVTSGAEWLMEAMIFLPTPKYHQR